jgi:hypothetical protein
LLTDAIQYHHNPQKSSPQSRNIVSIVHIADLLMSRFHTGVEIDEINKNNSENFNQILANVGLSAPDMSRIIDNIPLYIFDLNS